MVILVRHAEPQQFGSDPHLDDAGRRRAGLLAKMLGRSGVTAIFTSGLKRTEETAHPLAITLGVSPQVIDNDASVAAAQVLAAGSCVLVVGHTDTIPPLIAALGGPDDVTIASDEFDRLFVLSATLGNSGTLLEMRYVSS